MRCFVFLSRHWAKRETVVMRLVSVTYAKNEADIIEAFVRHHVALLDHVVVVDHDSTDATRTILQKLVEEGLPLTLLEDSALAYQQATRTTSLARHAFKILEADYVFPLDADEFVRGESRVALESSLGAIPSGKIPCLAWQNYVVSPDDELGEINPVCRIVHRATQEPSPEHKVVLPRSFATATKLGLTQGNHFVATGVANEVIEMHPMSGISLAHFPIRGQQHLLQKALLGWLSVRLQNPAALDDAESAAQKKTSRSWQRRELFREACRDPDFSLERLQRLTWKLYVEKTDAVNETLAVELVCDPLPVFYELRYTGRNSGNALASLARWSDRLLSQIARGTENRAPYAKNEVTNAS
jgi:hypothetical protein